MRTLSFCLDDFEALKALPNTDERETCFVCYVARVATVGPAADRFVVREFEEVPPDAYTTRTTVLASLHPRYLLSVANKARALDAGVVLGHTHPKEFGKPNFSRTDDSGEKDLSQYFDNRIPANAHFAFVISPHGQACRVLGTREDVRLTAVGKHVLSSPGLGDLRVRDEEIFDRQVRAFGREGQQTIQGLR